MRYVFIFLSIVFMHLQASDILKEFDKKRINTDEGKVELSISSFKKNKTKTKEYSVFRKDNKSLVAFMHKSEKGTVVLNSLNNLYIKVPSSKKAIRITPIQRLLGDASIGDILELSFDKYYDLKEKNEDKYILIAKEKTSTYHRINLYTKSDRLDYAELFSYSGKLLKTVHYIYNEKQEIDKYKFVSKSSYSIVHIKKVRDMKLPNRLFKKSNIKKAFKNAISL